MKDEQSFLGDFMQASQNGSSVSYIFTGTNIGFVTEKGPDMGEIDIYIDGAYQQTVNCYVATKSYQNTVYENKNLSRGQHQIRIIKKNGAIMKVDRLKLYNDNLSTPMKTPEDETYNVAYNKIPTFSGASK